MQIIPEDDVNPLTQTEMVPKTSRSSMRRRERKNESKLRTSAKNVQFKIETDFDDDQGSNLAFQAQLNTPKLHKDDSEDDLKYILK